VVLIRLVQVCRCGSGETGLRVEIHSDKVYCFGDTNYMTALLQLRLRHALAQRIAKHFHVLYFATRRISFYVFSDFGYATP
jgi:hypothetical protein